MIINAMTKEQILPVYRVDSGIMVTLCSPECTSVYMGGWNTSVEKQLIKV